ncbi:putative WD repeat-containing protein [Tolypocladium ophioglossoides CBS 100239]|uniref:Putative WD repeat-containing protein n=1 Tax=Tolypocladium ophioglossoides (strain CBS 100239) TaxID=1163406 RepID=A0A0L0N7U7_TOLOC|nr:putative WD repeat-containing protein [Tolypocladium ophioglossoides CBS 100239]
MLVGDGLGSSLSTSLSSALSSLGRILKIGETELENSRVQGHLDAHGGPVTSLNFSHDAKVLVSTSTDRSGKAMLLKTLGSGHPNCKAVFSYDHKILAWESDEWTIEIRNVATGTRSGRALKRPYEMSLWAFSLRSKMLALTKLINAMEIWAIGRHTVTTCGSRFDAITSFVFSHDDKQVAAASDDGAVKVWETNSGECIYTFRIGLAAPRTTLFDPTGSHLITEVGTLHLGEAGSVAPSTSTTSVPSRLHDWLWLPPEYRPRYSAVTDSKHLPRESPHSPTVAASTVGIGCKSGRV